MSGRKRNVKSATLKSGVNGRNGKNTSAKQELPQTSETSEAMSLRKSPGKHKEKEKGKSRNPQAKREMPQTSDSSEAMKSPGKPEDKGMEDSDVEHDKLSIINSFNISPKDLLKLLEEHQIKQQQKENQAVKTDGAHTSAEEEKYGDSTTDVEITIQAKTPVEHKTVQSPVLSDEIISQELQQGITAELDVLDCSETEIPSQEAETETPIHENIPRSQAAKTEIDFQKPQVPSHASEKPHNSPAVECRLAQKHVISTPEETIRSPTAKTVKTFQKQLSADSGRSLKSPALEAQLNPGKPLVTTVQRQTPVKRRRSSKSPRGCDSNIYADDTEAHAQSPALDTELIPEKPLTTTVPKENHIKRRRSSKSSGSSELKDIEDSTPLLKTSTTHSPGKRSSTVPIEKCKLVEALAMTEEPEAKIFKSHTPSPPLLEVDTPEKKTKLSVPNAADTDLGAVSGFLNSSESCHLTCKSNCSTEKVMHSYNVIKEDNSLKMKLKRKSMSDIEKELKAKYGIKPSNVILIPLLPKEIECWENITDQVVTQKMPLASPFSSALESIESKESHSIVGKSEAFPKNDIIPKTLMKGSAEKAIPEAPVFKFTKDHISDANSNRSPKPAPKCKKRHLDNSPAPKCKKKSTSSKQCKSDESGSVKKVELYNKLEMKKKDDGFAFVIPLPGGSMKTSKGVSIRSSSSQKLKKKDQIRSDHKTQIGSRKPTSSQKNSFSSCPPVSYGLDPLARFLGQTTAADPLKKFQEDSEVLDFEPGGDDEDLDCLSIMADPNMLSGYASEWKPSNEDVIKPTVYAPIDTSDFVSSPPPSPVFSERSVDDFDDESAEKCDTMNTKFQDPCEKNDDSEDIAPTVTSALGIPVESYALEDLPTFESTSPFQKQSHDISKSPPPVCKSLIESHVVREDLEVPCVKETLSDIIASELKMATESPMLVCDNVDETVQDTLASPQAQPEVQGSEQNTIDDTSVDDVSDSLKTIESEKQCENVIPSSSPTNISVVETSTAAEKHATSSGGLTPATQKQAVVEQDGGMHEIESHDLKQLDQSSCSQKDSITLPQSQQDNASTIPEDNLLLCTLPREEGSIKLVTEKRPEANSTNTSSEKCSNLEKRAKEEESREIVTELRPKEKDEQGAKTTTEKVNRNLFPENKPEHKEIGSERQSSLTSGCRRDRTFSDGRRKPPFQYGGAHLSQPSEPKIPLLPTPVGPSQNVSVKTTCYSDNVPVSIERQLLNYGYHNREPTNSPVMLPIIHTSTQRRLPASNSYSSSVCRDISPENQAQSQIMCAPQDQEYPCAQYSCDSYYGTGFQAPSSILGSYGTDLPIEPSGLCIPSCMSEVSYSSQKLDAQPSYLNIPTGPTRTRPCDTISPSHERPRSYETFSHVNVGRGDVDMRCRDVEPVQGDNAATNSSDSGAESLREYCLRFLASGMCNMKMNCGLKHEFPNILFPIPWDKVNVLKLLKTSLSKYRVWMKNSLNDFICFFSNQSDVKSLKDIAAIFWLHNLKISNYKKELLEFSIYWIRLVEAFCDCGLPRNEAVKAALMNSTSQNFIDSVPVVLDHILDVLYPDFISKSTQTWQMVSCLTEIQVYEMPFKVLKVVLDSCVEENLLSVNREVAEYLLHKKYSFRYDNQEIEYLHQIHRLTKLLRNGRENRLADKLEELYTKDKNDNCCDCMPNMMKFIPRLRRPFSSHKSNSQNFNLNTNDLRNRRTIGSASKGRESATGIEGNNDTFIKSPAKLAAPLMAGTYSQAQKPLNTERSEFDLPPQISNPKPVNFKIVVNNGERDVIAETPTVQHDANVDTCCSEVVKSPTTKSSFENQQPRSRPTLRNQSVGTLIEKKKFGAAASHIKKWCSNSEVDQGASIVTNALFQSDNIVKDFDILLKAAGSSRKVMSAIGFQLMKKFADLNRFKEGFELLLLMKGNNFDFTLSKIAGFSNSKQYLMLIDISIKSHNAENALEMLIEKRLALNPGQWLLDHHPEDVPQRDSLCLLLFNCLRSNEHLAIKTDALFREMMQGKDSYSQYDVPSLLDNTLRALMRTNQYLSAYNLLVWCDNSFKLSPDDSTSRMMLMSMRNFTQEEHRNLAPAMVLILNRKPYKKAFPEQIEGLPRVFVTIDSIWFSWEVKCIVRFFTSAHLSNLKSKTIPKVSLIIKECPLPVVNADDFPKGLLEASPSLSDAQLRIQHALQRPFNLIPQSIDKNSNIIELDQKQLEAFVQWWRGKPVDQTRTLLQLPGPTTLSEPSLQKAPPMANVPFEGTASVSSPWNAGPRLNTPSSERVTGTPATEQRLRRRPPAPRVTRSSGPHDDGHGSWGPEVDHPPSYNTQLNRRPPYSLPSRDWSDSYDDTPFSNPNQASYRMSYQGQFENSNQSHFSNANQGQFANPNQGQFANPYQGQFANPYQGQFANPNQGQFNPYQGQFANPDQSQFANPDQSQFANPDQDQFASHNYYPNPNRPQFPTPDQRSFPILNQVPDQPPPLLPSSDLRSTLPPRRRYDNDNHQVHRNQSRGGGRGGWRTNQRSYHRDLPRGRGTYGW